MTTVHRVGAAMALMLAFSLASSGTAFALYSDLDPVADKDELKAATKCYRAILKESTKYMQAAVKNVDKCKKDVVKKGPDTKFTDLAECAKVVVEGGVSANADVQGLIDKNDAKRQKMRDGIAKQCGGKDKACGVGVDDEADVPLSNYNWGGGACQAFETSGCEGIAVADCGDIGDCLACHIDFAVDQVVDDVLADQFDDTLFGEKDDKTGKTINKCQQAALKEGGKFFIAKRKNLLKCADKKVKRKGDGFDDGVACPDTDPKLGGTGLPKTVEKILKVEQKLAAGICKKCGGENDGDKDGVCDVPAGFIDTNLDFVGGAYPACPALTLPPSGSGILDAEHRYGTDCGAIATTTLQGYIDCVNCVAEWKADCLTHAANGNEADAPLGIAYPSECGATASTCGDGVVGAGEDCDTAAAAPQCPNAGQGLQVCNVDCTCSCPSVVTFEADPNDPLSNLDTGFVGFAHNAKVIGDGVVTVSLSGGTEGVPGRRDPTCGIMDIGGPIPNPAAGAGQLATQRCSLNSSILCAADSDCPASQTCDDYFGGPLPLSAGGVSSCIINRFVAPIVGTADVETGESANTVSLTSEVHVGPADDKPCTNCIGDGIANDGIKGGTCDTGPPTALLAAGTPCDVNGRSPTPAFNGRVSSAQCTAAGVPAACCTGAGTGTCGISGTSHDCPYAAGTDVGVLPIDLSNSTGPESLTVQASGPSCTASGFTTAACMCDTCATLAAEPCNADSDCPAAITCGGLRCLGGTVAGAACTTPGINTDCGRCSITSGTPCTAASHCPAAEVCLNAPCGNLGEPTKPNACVAACTPLGGGKGECDGSGPFDGSCTPVETFRGCTLPSDCPFPGDTCGFFARPCFLDGGVVGGTIDATGAPDTPVNDTSNPSLASVFCIAPTGAGAINGAAGLPGTGRVTLTGTAVGQP